MRASAISFTLLATPAAARAAASWVIPSLESLTLFPNLSIEVAHPSVDFLASSRYLSFSLMASFVSLSSIFALFNCCCQFSTPRSAAVCPASAFASSSFHFSSSAVRAACSSEVSPVESFSSARACSYFETLASAAATRSAYVSRYECELKASAASRLAPKP